MNIRIIWNNSSGVERFRESWNVLWSSGRREGAQMKLGGAQMELGGPKREKEEGRVQGQLDVPQR